MPRLYRAAFLFVIAAVTAFPAVTFAQVQSGDDLSALPEAQNDERQILRFENLSVGNGLSQGTVYTMFEDSQGFMWFATQDGLNMYDGYETTVYNALPFDSTSLADGWTWSVNESRDGSIWVGTQGGLSRLDRGTGKFTHYRHNPADSTTISAGRAWDAVEDVDGNMWIAMERGVDILDRSTNTFRHLVHVHEDSTTVGPGAGEIHIDADGFVWTGTSEGLSRIDGETLEVTNYLYGLNPETPAGYQLHGAPSRVYTVQEFDQDPGILWLGTGNGFVRFEKATGTSERFKVVEVADNGDEFTVYDIAQDPNDSDILWAGTANDGLARFNKLSKTIQQYRSVPGNSSGLISNSIYSLRTDRAGIIWAGTQAGVSRFNPASLDFVTIEAVPDKNATNGVNPWGMLAERSGSLWIASSEPQGRAFLTRMDARTGKTTTWEGAGFGQTIEMGRGSMNGLFQDENGYVWIGSGGAITRYDPETGRRTNWAANSVTDTLNAVPPVLINRLEGTRDGSGRLWVGAAGDGLFLVDLVNETPNSKVSLGDSLNRNDNYIQSIQHDLDGDLWVTTATGGLFRMNSDTTFTRYQYNRRDTTSLSSNFVFGFAERPSEPGILWVFSQAGIDRFDKASGKVTRHVAVKDGLPNAVVYQVIVDDEENLWYSTNNGFGQFNPVTNQFRNYGLDSGIRQLEHMQWAAAKGPDGTIYFGNVDGVTAFNPAMLRNNPIPPSIAFRDFKIHNQSVLVGPDSPLKQPLDRVEEITLRASENAFSFDFVGLHFGNPEKNEYAYKLDDWDNDWNNVGHLRTASYTNLPAGTYTFRVKAANADGAWNEVGRSVRLIVRPPWWKTWWAYGLYAILLGLTVFAVDRIQRRRLSIKERERSSILEAQLRADSQLKRRQDAEKLSEIGRAITSTLSVRGIIDTVYENVNALMDASVFAVGVLNEPEERIDFPNSKEQGQTLPTFAHYLSDPNRLSVYCLSKQEDIVIGDYVNEYKKYVDVDLPPVQGEAPSSIVYLPLVHQGKSVGVITAQSFAKNAYSEYHLSVLRSLASYAAIALDNADAYRKLGATVENLKAAQARLVQSEKMASLGEMTAGIAHEIKNPLNFVNNFAELNAELAEELAEALRDGDDPAPILEDIKNNAAQIQSHGKRADSIVRAMMQHASGGAGHQELTNVNPLVEEYIGLAYHGMRASTKNFNVELVKDFDGDAGTIPMVPQEIGRVLLNLLGNAFYVVRERANNEGEEYKPTVTITTRKLRDSIEIRVADNGSGIPDHVKERIFEPFFTTKPTGSGTGLGLSLSYDIVTKGHGGEMTVDSEPGKGAEFTITLPLKDVVVSE